MLVVGIEYSSLAVLPLSYVASIQHQWYSQCEEQGSYVLQWLSVLAGHWSSHKRFLKIWNACVLPQIS